MVVIEFYFNFAVIYRYFWARIPVAMFVIVLSPPSFARGCRGGKNYKEKPRNGVFIACYSVKKSAKDREKIR